MNDGSFRGGATSGAFQSADDMANRARQTAEQALHDIKGRAADYLDLGCGKAAEMTETVGQQIRRQPVAAVAVAAGIGFALGFLWTRRK